MNRSRVDIAWSLFSLAVADILNPLLLISTALFVGVGYVLTLLMPVNIDIWAALLVISVVLPLGLLAARARRQWRQCRAEAEGFSWRCLLPILPLVIFLPPALAVLSLPSIFAIPHLEFYFPHITQLYHSVTPLDNVFVPGHPAVHYWLFYALVATVIKLSSLDIYTTFNLVNLAFLFSSLIWLGKALTLLHLARARTVILGFMILFVFCSVNLNGFFSMLSHALNGVIDIPNKGLLLFEGADRRLHSIFPKVYSASGMTPGICAFIAALYALARVLRDGLQLQALIVFSAAGIVALAVMPVVALFIAVPLLGGFALTVLRDMTSNVGRPSSIAKLAAALVANIGTAQLAIWLIGSLALALPLLRYVDGFTGSYQADVSIMSVNPTNLRVLLAATILLLPPAAVQFVRAWRSQERLSCFLGFCAILGVILVLTVVFPDQNQYKLYYPLSIVLAVLTLQLFRSVSEMRSAAYRKFASSLTFMLVALALFNAMVGALAVIGRARSNFGIGSFKGLRAITVDNYGGRQPAFDWIADNSSSNGVVLVTHAYMYYAPLLLERLMYVNKWSYYYADRIPDHAIRLDEIHWFYDDSTSLEEYELMLESMQDRLPGRPLYAVVMDPELSRETMAQRGAEIVFENPPYGAHVYLLNPPASG